MLGEGNFLLKVILLFRFFGLFLDSFVFFIIIMIGFYFLRGIRRKG